jgi:hypothetical protein
VTSRPDHRHRPQAPLADLDPAGGVPERPFARDQAEQADIGHCPRRQGADPSAPPDRPRQIAGDPAEHLGQRDFEVEELAGGRGQVVDRPGDAPGVDIGTDRPRQQPLRQRLARDREVETARAVPDIEEDAALAGLPDGGAHLTVVIEHALGAAMVAVGDDIAGAEHGEQFRERHCGAAHMDHRRLAARLGHLPGAPQRLAALRAIAIARSTRAQRMSSNSPTSSAGLPSSRAMPRLEMWSMATMRVAETSMMYRRKAGKVAAPADPASTAVVTPTRQAVGADSTPSGGTPQKTCVCRSTRPRVTSKPAASTTPFQG